MIDVLCNTKYFLFGWNAFSNKNNGKNDFSIALFIAIVSGHLLKQHYKTGQTGNINCLKVKKPLLRMNNSDSFQLGFVIIRRILFNPSLFKDLCYTLVEWGQNSNSSRTIENV